MAASSITLRCSWVRYSALSPNRASVWILLSHHASVARSYELSCHGYSKMFMGVVRLRSWCRVLLPGLRRALWVIVSKPNTGTTGQTLRRTRMPSTSATPNRPTSWLVDAIWMWPQSQGLWYTISKKSIVTKFAICRYFSATLSVGGGLV